MTVETKPRSATGTAFARAGYVVAMIVNAVILVIANNLLSWGFPAFLTDDFRRVLPLINFSLVATIVVNFVYLGRDTPWFKALCQAGLGVISLAATIRFLRVFPFDFTMYPGFEWAVVARVVLWIAVVGSAIGIVTEVAKSIRSYPTGTPPAPLTTEHRETIEV